MTCQGSKGQSPLASLGTAQRLAPVHSGLPLLRNLPVISPTTEPTPTKPYFPPLRYQIKIGDDGGFVGAGTDCGRKRKAPISIDFLFLKQAVHASLRCKESDNHVPYPALYSFLRLACSIHPSTNAFLLYYPIISVFLFWISSHFC